MQGFDNKFKDFPDYILGITNEMSRGEKIHKLKEDFSKWNSRLNVVSSQEEKDNAQAMIDLISKELTKLR